VNDPVSPEEWERLDEDEPKSAATQFGESVGVVIGAVFVLAAGVLLIAALIGGGYAITQLLPGSVPLKQNPGYLDTIFSNRYVVFAARLAILATSFVLLFAALYVVASVAVRMSRGHWLRRAGWFEVDVIAAEQRLAQIEPLLATAWESNEDLARKLESASDEIQQLQEQREMLYELLVEREPPEEEGDGDDEAEAPPQA
jgi:Ca2+/Na+ antiporter